MKKQLDARNLDCPKPILETQKIFQDENVSQAVILVGNKTAKENLKRMANTKGYDCHIEEHGDDQYTVTISRTKPEGKEEPKGNTAENIEEKNTEGKGNLPTEPKGLTYLILSDELGRGEAELGKLLMKGFLYTLTQTQPLPEKLVLLNSAVKLSTENPETIEHLKALENEGVMIYSCGTCLNFYDLADNLQAGIIGNMYDVVEAINQTHNKITVG